MFMLLNAKKVGENTTNTKTVSATKERLLLYLNSVLQQLQTTALFNSNLSLSLKLERVEQCGQSL